MKYRQTLRSTNHTWKIQCHLTGLAVRQPELRAFASRDSRCVNSCSALADPPRSQVQSTNAHTGSICEGQVLDIGRQHLSTSSAVRCHYAVSISHADRPALTTCTRAKCVLPRKWLHYAAPVVAGPFRHCCGSSIDALPCTPLHIYLVQGMWNANLVVSRMRCVTETEACFQASSGKRPFQCGPDSARLSLLLLQFNDI